MRGSNGRATNRHRVKASLSFTEEEGFLLDLVLNKESIGVNLNEKIIIRNKFISRNKIFIKSRNMQTCSICHLNQIISMISSCTVRQSRSFMR